MAENLSQRAGDGRKHGTSRTTKHHIPGVSEPLPSSSFKQPQSSSVSLSGNEPLPDHPIVPLQENHEISTVEDLQGVVDEFPTAHGLSLLFSNQTGDKENTPIIHNSSRAMSLVMGNLSFATRIYQDQSNDKFRHTLKAISKVHFGASYKCIFIYCTGHGEKGYINVTDGKFSINEMKSILSPAKAPSLKNMVIYIFWDCCRTIVDSREVLMTQTELNLVTVYSVPINQQSLLDPIEGLSVTTKELIKLLLKPRKECNLFDLLTVKLTNKVNKARRPLRTDFEGSVSHIIYQHKDKLMSMSPRNIKVTENHDEDTCLISWEAPHHGHKYNLQGYSIIDENLTYIEFDIRELKVTLSRSKVCNRRVTVCAHYEHLAEIRKGGEECVNEELVVDGYRDGECSLVSLESDSLIPTNVQVSFPHHGHLTWTKPIAFWGNYFEYVSVQRASTDNTEGEDGWRDVTRRSRVEGSSYEIVAPNPRRYKYRMRIHDGRRTSPWIPADQQEPENLSCFKQVFVAKQILPFIFIITFLFVSAILYVAIVIFLALVNPSGYHLIVADEIPIDCDHLNWFQKMIYSHVFIKEEPNNFEHDYIPGFNITIWSEKKENFNISDLDWTFESNVTTTDSIFQIKNKNNDTYMWKDSNIYFKTDERKEFSSLQAFLIKGNINKNYFYDQHTLHWTERTQDLLTNNFVNWYVSHNDYYYVFVIAELPDSVPFASFQTDVHYSINNCNVANNSSTIKRLDNVARSIGVAIDFLNRNRTLCRGIADSIHLKVDKTHLHLTYTTRYEFVYAIPPPIALLLTVCIFNHFCCKYALCCVCKQLVKQFCNQVKQWRLRVQQRNGYYPIQ